MGDGVCEIQRSVDFGPPYSCRYIIAVYYIDVAIAVAVMDQNIKPQSGKRKSSRTAFFQYTSTTFS